MQMGDVQSHEVSERKRRLLEQLRDQIISDNLTPLLAESATQLVMGDGYSDADIVLIGEAPGRQEDLKGKPFIGASGRFLDTMLATTGLTRSEVYITNIVKYRPPNNRDPTVAEKKAFGPYLLRQLEIISPKVVITLGRHSGEFFIPTLQISRDHGIEQRVELYGRQILVVPLYHPAVALYNGSMRSVLLEDFERAINTVRLL